MADVGEPAAPEAVPAAEAEAPAATTDVKTPKKKKSPKKANVKKAASKVSAHPKWRDMVISAISEMKERNGSSRQAILKYIQGNFKDIDEKNCGNHLKMTLKACVKNGTLRQAKGTGASGSFKLGEKNTPKTATKKKSVPAPKPRKAVVKATPKKQKRDKKAVKPKKNSKSTPKAKSKAQKTQKLKKTQPAKKAKTTKAKKPKTTKK